MCASCNYWYENICGQCETVNVLVAVVAVIVAHLLMIADSFWDCVLEGKSSACFLCRPLIP